MDGVGADHTKPLAKAPRTRTCYICGRGYGLSSFEIHLKQCKDLWIAREEKKPLRERKPVPADPFLGQTGESSVSTNGSSSPRAKSSTNFGEPTPEELEAMNAAAYNSYNEVALFKCAFCGRSFLEEKLKIHNKSCTAEKPARRADAKVKVGKTPVDVSRPGESANAQPPSRPKTTGGAPNRKGQKIQIEEIFDDPSQGQARSRPLAGPIGGSASREMRQSPRASGEGLPAQLYQQSASSSAAPRSMSNKPGNKAETLKYLLTRLEDMEESSVMLAKSIAEVKQLVNQLQSDP